WIGQYDHWPALDRLSADSRKRSIEETLARAIDGMNLARRVHLQCLTVPSPDPGRDGSAEIIRAPDLWIGPEQVFRFGHLVDDEPGHRLPRVARGHLDDFRMAGRHAIEQPGNARERRQDHA